MILTIFAFFCIQNVLAHIPFLDDGSHISFDSAFSFSDEIVARTLNIDFNCTSPPSYSKVEVRNSTSFHVGVGIPDIPSLYDVKPDLWVIGKSVVPSEKYTDTISDSQVIIPPGYTGYKVKSQDSGLFIKFGEESAHIEGVILLGVTVNVTQSGPVYLVIENPWVASRVWLAVGTKEEPNKLEVGEASTAEVEYWYESDTFSPSSCDSSNILTSSSTYDSMSSSSNTYYSVDTEAAATSKVISATSIIFAILILLF